MEWSKIKNIVILILAVVNLFLLVLVADQEWKTRQYEEAGRLGAVEVLANGGIAMDPGLLPPESGLAPLTAERDRAGEAALAEALLERAEKTDDKGRDTYRGEKGEALFRSDGSFLFTFVPGAWSVAGEDLGAHAASLLKRAGYPCRAVAPEPGEDPSNTAAVQQTLNGAPVFNYRTVLRYEDGDLRSIEGWRLIGPPAPAGGDASMNVATVLLRFLAGVRENGYVCSEILGMTAGYEGTLETSGQARLSPVWQIVTDARTFYVDAATGAVQPEK